MIRDALEKIKPSPKRRVLFLIFDPWKQFSSKGDRRSQATLAAKVDLVPWNGVLVTGNVEMVPD